MSAQGLFLGKDWLQAEKSQHRKNQLDWLRNCTNQCAALCSNVFLSLRHNLISHFNALPRLFPVCMRKVDKSADFLLTEGGSVARTRRSALTTLLKKKKNCYNGICYLNMPDCSVLFHLSQRHTSREHWGHLPWTSCLCNCMSSWWDVTIWFHYAKVTTQDHSCWSTVI